MGGLRSEISRLAALLSIVAAYHPRGLRVLLGDEPEPTMADLDEIIRGMTDRAELGTFVEGGRQSQAALDLVCRLSPLSGLVEKAGGWGNIAASARQVKDLEPLAWNLFAEAVLWGGQGSKLNGCGHIERLSLKYRVSTRTIQRWSKEVPRMIARHALLGGQSVLWPLCVDSVSRIV